MKKRPKTPSRPVDDSSREVLREIYRPTGAETLRTFERKPRRRLRRWLILLIVFVALAAAAAVAGMSLFTNDDRFSGGDVSLTLSGPEQAAAGDDYVVKAEVENRGSVGITNVELSVRFPDGFTVSDSTPAAANGLANVWSIGNIAANKKATVQITGRLIGEVGSEAIFSGTVQYEPANFSSEFVDEASFTTRLTQAALDLTVDAPHAVTTGQEVRYRIEVKNVSDRDVARVRLELAYPDGLSELSTDPRPTSGTRQWDRDALKPDASFAVTVKGELNGDPSSVHELKAVLGVLDDTAAFLTQRETSALVLILAPTLNIQLTSNGKSGGFPVNSRDTIPVLLRYSNDSDSELTDATVTLSFAGKDSDGASVALVDPEKITSPSAFTKANGDTAIRWTKDDISGLERIVPGAHGVIEATLPLKNGLRTVGSGMNLQLEVSASVTATSGGGSSGGYEGKSETSTFRVNTEMRLAAEGRYATEEGEQVGSGPLPPQVGATTTYTVYWYVTNTLNGANNALLSATIPAGVTFMSAETNGGNNITYDETARTVRWRIEKVDARVGQTLPTLVGSFRVSVTPTDADVGKTLQLLGTTNLTASDAFTDDAITLSSDGVTTDLANDPTAAGKGTVQAAAATNSNANSAP